MISNFPWLLVAVLVYNVIVFTFGGSAEPNGGSEAAGAVAILNTQIIPAIPLISGEFWELRLGDFIIILTLVLLFVELVKATRTSSYSIIDHAFSMIVFIICIIEFLAVKQAATSVFFIITVVVLIDVIAGFTITIKAAKRDVAFGGHGDMH